MALPIKTGFPDGHTLSAGYTVRFRATDPTTGADVSGVKITNASVFADSGGAITLTPADNDPVVLTPPVFELTGTQVRHQ